MTLSKSCAVCGERFEKPSTVSLRTWNEKRKCCSSECGNALKRGRPNPKLGDAHRGKKQSREHVAKRSASAKRAYAEGRVKPARANLGLRGDQTSQWKGDDIGYRAAHARLYVENGSPLTCAICEGLAHEWALRQDAVVRKVESAGRFAGKEFSTRPSDYFPACRSCHRQYDGRERDTHTGRYL